MIKAALAAFLLVDTFGTDSYPVERRQPILYIMKVGEGNIPHTTPTVVYHFLFIMQFLNNVRAQDQTAPVTLLVNEESYAVTPANYQGKTVAQLFAQYASNLGVDASRIQSYILDATQVPGETVVRPGEVYRGVITSESKG